MIYFCETWEEAEIMRKERQKRSLFKRINIEFILDKEEAEELEIPQTEIDKIGERIGAKYYIEL